MTEYAKRDKSTSYTKKQEGFCRDVLVMDSASDAFRANYDCSRSKAATVHRKAVQMMNQPKIQARIAELKRESAKVWEISVQQKKEWLKQVIEAGLEALEDGKRVGLNATVSAIAELNRMDGDHAAEHRIIDVWVDKADAEEKIKRRSYIEAELENRGLLTHDGQRSH